MRISARPARSRRLIVSTVATMAVAVGGTTAYLALGDSPAAAKADAAPAVNQSADPSAQIGHESIGQTPTSSATSPAATAGGPPGSPTKPGTAASATPAAKTPGGGKTATAKPGAKPDASPTATGAAPPGVGSPAVPVPVPGGWSAKGTDAGPLNGSTGLTVTFALGSRDPNGLASYAAAVSDPASAQYRRFLSNTDYAARFGPDPAVRDGLAVFLSSAGLKVTRNVQDYVSVAGTASQVQRALAVSLRNYSLGGAIRYAPTGAISLPADVAPAVQRVTGLDNAPSPVKPTSFGTKPSVVGAVPGCTHGYGTASGLAAYPNAAGASVYLAPCPYTFQQIRHAYNVDASGYDGRGVTVGIVDIYNPPTLFNDASVYARTHGWPGFAPLQFTVVDDPQTGYAADCDPTGWYGESAMDVQAVHAMAPAANVVYGAAGCAAGGADNTYGMLDYMISNHLVDIISNSWSSLEGEMDQPQIDALNTLAQQAAAKGIGLYFATGDCGDDNNACGQQKRPAAGACPSTAPPAPQKTHDCTQHAEAEFPASSPYVTAVGGTAMAADAQGNRLFDAPWADSVARWQPATTTPPVQPGAWGPSLFYQGSGGGVSALSGHPAWQSGSAGGRTIPDISMDAAPETGMEFGEHLDANGTPDPRGNYRVVTEGGTSLATPLFAGLQALAQQKHGAPLGFANPALYRLAGTAAINDVTATPQNNQALVFSWGPAVAIAQTPSGVLACGTGGTGALCKGYDLVTGIGTPSNSYLASY